MKNTLIIALALLFIRCSEKEENSTDSAETENTEKQEEVTDKASGLAMTHVGVIEDFTMEEMNSYEEGEVEYHAVVVSYEENGGFATVWVPVEEELWTEMKEGNLIGMSVDLHIKESGEVFLLYP